MDFFDGFNVHKTDSLFSKMGIIRKKSLRKPIQRCPICGISLSIGAIPGHVKVHDKNARAYFIPNVSSKKKYELLNVTIDEKELLRKQKVRQRALSMLTFGKHWRYWLTRSNAPLDYLLGGIEIAITGTTMLVKEEPRSLPETEVTPFGKVFPELIPTKLPEEEIVVLRSQNVKYKPIEERLYVPVRVNNRKGRGHNTIKMRADG